MCSPIKGYAYPNHHSPATKGHVLMYYILCNTLPSVPPNMLSSVCGMQQEHGLISKKDMSPSIAVPTTVDYAAVKSFLLVTRLQLWTLKGTVCTYATTMKPVVDYLVGYSEV